MYYEVIIVNTSTFVMAVVKTVINYLNLTRGRMNGYQLELVVPSLGIN